MFSTQSAEFNLNVPCRAFSPVEADKVDSRFLVASNSLNETNYVYVLRFHSDANELGVDGKLEYSDGPIHAICSCPTDPTLLLAVAEQTQPALYRISNDLIRNRDVLPYDPDDESALDVTSTTESLEEVAVLQSASVDRTVDLIWRDASDESTVGGGDVLTMSRKGALTQWDITGDAAKVVRSVQSPDHKFTPGWFPRAAWDPHSNGEAVAVTSGTKVGILDWRVDTSIPSGVVDSFSCHRFGVTDLDYNPNKPYVLATAGQDALTKFWDLRFVNRPLLVARGGHSHWISRVKYNPFHDQLVLSSGTDSVVNLWRLSTISSAPLLALDGDNESDLSEESAPNARVARHEYSDSVYQVGWSAADAWIYMAVGYDGKAVLNHVPSKEKYKILL